MGTPINPITHEDILAFIDGWDLVRMNDIINTNPLEDEEEEQENDE